MSKIIDTSELKKIIIGRVKPYIYSFVTNTLPNYLKVGDTYRPVEERLAEWKKHYIDLEEVYRHPATIKDEVFFRDHSVHKYLNQKGIEQVNLNAAKNIHSKEFFDGANKSDVAEAINDIVSKYNKTDSYQYYHNIKDRHEYHYERKQIFKPRHNQQVVLDAFKNAISIGRTNLLMYAVMRFGKSITSLWSAKSMNSKLTVVVSAKADVKSEWKYTTESHVDFKGYRFLCADDLKKITNLSEIYGKKFKIASNEEICTNIVLFVTLHDLAGSTKSIKKHHKIFKNSVIDLLIIDETHFGARAEVLGKLLTGIVVNDEEKKLLKTFQEDEEKISSLDKLEAIKAKTKLHLSGTPYRILMGREFEKRDIIAQVQFSDIYEAKLQWLKENLDKTEWDNPYYGFPQMVRFAFNPNESSRKKLSANPGSKPSALFTPISINTDGDYQTFIHEQEIIDLLQILDGSKNDTQLLGLLNNEFVKKGNLAQHVVIVLPLRASCDALQKLIEKNKKIFKNFGQYKLINISGYDSKINKTDDVKSAISEAAKAGQKTITFTVNKMLTGSTVPQWDTMIFLKGTTSPQEYDQAIFRLQSPWIEEYRNKNGEVIKYDMKPQTLLLDLDPTRLFYLQEKKAFIFGANSQKVGNENIKKNIERELRVSPIIALNAEQNKLVEITATNIIDEVRKYANERTIVEDVCDIGIDISLKDNKDIYAIISRLAELGDKNGLNIKPYQDVGTDFEVSITSDGSSTNHSQPSTLDKLSNDAAAFEKRFRTYYVMIILFAFLSNTEEKSLSDIINNIEKNKDNSRIATNLGLKKNHLELIQTKMQPYILSTLDYKIQNTDSRSSDASISPTEHIEIAINKFGRLSDSEVFTPERIVNLMYESFDNEFWKVSKDAKIIDIASKSGNFARGYVKKALLNGVKIEDIKDSFYSIPTSKAAYEFTRKMYDALGLNIENIAQHFTSYDLINCDVTKLQILLGKGKKFSDIQPKDLEKFVKIKKTDNNNIMKFTAIVGNPPYQESDGGAQASAKPIYNLFVETAKSLSPDYISIIMPTRWYAGGKGLDSFRRDMLNDIHISELHDFLRPELIFPDNNLRGGICYFLWSKSHNNTKNFTKVFTYQDTLEASCTVRNLKTEGLDIFIRHELAINLLDKVTSHPKFRSFNDFVSSRKPFGLEGGVINDSKIFNFSPSKLKIPLLCYGKNMKIGYVEREKIKKNITWIDRIKVFAPYANNIATELNDDNLNAFISDSGTICTETYIVMGSNLMLDKNSAKNLVKYFTTKFARFMHSIPKISQHGTSKTYRFVPLQDFTNKSDIVWTKSIAEIDQQLFDKYKLDKKERNFIDNIKSM